MSICVFLSFSFSLLQGQGHSKHHIITSDHNSTDERNLKHRLVA